MPNLISDASQLAETGLIRLLSDDKGPATLLIPSPC
jgi:hypothetical protein